MYPFSVRALKTVNKLLIIQIDGLSYPAIKKAIVQGFMPFCKSLLDRGWSLNEIFCGLPSTTPASQLSLFYGVSDLIPGFRFAIKDRQAVFRPTEMSETVLIEKLAYAKNPKPLLTHGCTVTTIYTGQARLSLSFGSIHKSKMTVFQLISFFLNPLRFIMFFLKLLTLYFIEIKEAKDAQTDKSSLSYFLTKRAIYEIFISELSFYFTKKAIRNRFPIIYVNFTGYDEVSHHYRPYSKASLYYLSEIDLYLKKLLAETRRTDINYGFIVLSDHGQSLSEPIYDKYGYTLGQKVQSIFPGYRVGEYYQGIDKHIEYSNYDFYLFSSGGLSLLYDFNSRSALDKKTLAKKYPDISERISKIDGVEFVITRQNGEMIVTKDGESSVFAEKNWQSLLQYIPLIERVKVLSQLRKIVFSPFGADLFIFGKIIDQDKVVAFEPQRGTHGGFGGDQTRSFVLAKNLAADFSNMEDLGDLYKPIYEMIHGRREETTPMAKTTS